MPHCLHMFALATEVICCSHCYSNTSIAIQAVHRLGWGELLKCYFLKRLSGLVLLYYRLHHYVKKLI